jgi:hypothetical protein
MGDLWHSWGDSPKQKAREKEYNHWYYEKFKEKILRNRRGPDQIWREQNYNNPDAGWYDETYYRQGGDLGKDDYGEDRQVGVSYVIGNKKNNMTIFDTKHSYWDDEAWKVKVGPVTYRRAEDGVSLTLDLNGTKQLTRVGYSIINAGKSIINKLKGGR